MKHILYQALPGLADYELESHLSFESMWYGILFGIDWLLLDHIFEVFSNSLGFNFMVSYIYEW